MYYQERKGPVLPVSDEYPGIGSPEELYSAMLDVWCADTCAPRMRSDWSKDNPSLGQCSITSFLAQDIFGGKVYGVPLPDGNFHCYNVVGEDLFDIASEQFGEEKLNYRDNPEQFREIHFAKEEKRLRYEELRRLLKEYLKTK
ncbi:MAG: hypothetical protein IJI78_04515 [Oscillospiraceae bacterium]|nr:hypothetical protein [Oscillospiraceae bacterium]